MSSNRNPTKTVQANNGYTRDDVVRVALEYQNERIKVIAEAIREAGGNLGIISEPLVPRIKKKIIKTSLPKVKGEFHS